MIKKYLSLALCLLIMLGVSAPAFASTNGAQDLSASFVEFKDAYEAAITSFPAGAPVFASTTVTNNGTSTKSAVLWLGLYRNDVLVDVEYTREWVPAGKTVSLQTDRGLFIPVDADSSTTKVKAYVWDSFMGANAIAATANMLEPNGELRYIRVDGTLLEGFSSGKTEYTYMVPEALTKRPVISSAAVDNATKVEVGEYTIPGEVYVTVTTGAGEEKPYKINMKWGPGTVTNIVNRVGTQAYRAFYNMRPQSLQGLRDIYRAVGAGWEDYCRVYVDRGLNATGAITDNGTPADGGRIPSENYTHSNQGLYLSDYGTGGGSGWLTMWFGKDTKAATPNSTSSFYEGASWIATGNNDKATPYMQENHPDGITFNISRGATIYLICNAGNSTNLTVTNGWTSGNNSMYTVVHGDGSVRSAYYVKHFNAGTVNIPSTGLANAGDRMYMPIIIWDTPTGMDNNDLSGIGFKMQGETTYTDIPSVSGSILSYDAETAPGSTESDIPELKVTTADPRAEVKITYPVSIPGVVTIDVTSVSGQKKTYTVNFEIGSASPSVNTLSSLAYNGTDVADFTPLNTVYDVVLPYRTTEVPVVTATPTDPLATADITQADSLPGSAAVLVTAQSGRQKTYTINFTVLDPQISNITNVGVSNPYSVTAGYHLYSDAVTPDVTSTLVYSDRTNVFYKKNSSLIFNDAAYIQTFKQDWGNTKYTDNTITTIWTTFKVNLDCTVYYGLPVSDPWVRGTSESVPWTKENGLKIAISGGPGDITNIYSKSYNAGDMVMVPNLGYPTGTGNASTSVILVVWN